MNWYFTCFVLNYIEIRIIYHHVIIERKYVKLSKQQNLDQIALEIVQFII